MVKRGSITVFLALTLGLILSLLSSGLESARMAAARTQILNGMDIGLYSLFGQYDKSLLKDFDLFAVDGACGGKEMNLASIYDNLESYMKPVMKQNSQKLSVQQGGISGYLLMTDSEGEVFYQQAVQYMKETLGSHGAKLLLNKIQDMQKKTIEAERQGNEIESKGTIENYESEMDTAQQKSQALLEEKKKQEQQNGQDGFTDGKMLPSVTEKNPPAKVENPIPVIRKVRKMGLLDLVLPFGKEVSDKKVKTKELVSGRKLETGLAMEDSVKADGSMLSQVLYQQYLMEKLGNYIEPGKSGLSYQIEYIIGKKNSDEANLKDVAKKLLMVREGLNVAYLVSDALMMGQIHAMAAAIAAAFLIPPAVVVIEGALILCWAFAESILDVRELFAGGKVPLTKNASNWQLSLQGLPALVDKLDTDRQNDVNGLSYEDYLQIFLLTTSKAQKVKGGMDMIESSFREMEDWNEFCLDHCITALEASVDVKANKRKVFTVTRGTNDHNNISKFYSTSVDQMYRISKWIKECAMVVAYFIRQMIKLFLMHNQVFAHCPIQKSSHR